MTVTEEQGRGDRRELADDAFVSSCSPDSSAWIIPDTVTQRYERMTAKLGIATTLRQVDLAQVLGRADDRTD